MSLFPAYTNDSKEKTIVDVSGVKKDDWLANSSFQVEVPDCDASSAKEVGNDTLNYSKVERKKKKSKKKIKKEKDCCDLISHTFTLVHTSSCRQYYIDRNPMMGYLSVTKLCKPACPKYHKRTFDFVGFKRKEAKYNVKRYYILEIDRPVVVGGEVIKSELDHFSAKIRDFNKRLFDFPKDVRTWIEYVNYQERVPFKLTKTQIAEKKIEILEKAMVHNYSNDSLYKCYVSILESTYPPFEISKFLDKLLRKDPTNYILWSAQINATQTSMARCVVPDVLMLYAQCMQQIYRQNKEDEIMLKLFKNVAIFLRQSGLSEQLFALIKLALELNVSTDKFSNIQPRDTDQQMLIDYEEVILNSGLPMNEIWLRIEKLRQNFNFLPWPHDSPCNDPQKIVFNQDICSFIFPLFHRENCFVLSILVLDILKVPFFIGTSFKRQFLFKPASSSEFDAVESSLIACLQQGICSNDFLYFDSHIYELVKVLTSGPSYLNTNVGYEIYFNTIMEILLLCSESFTNNERRRVVFIIMWLKFYRLLVVIERLSAKLTVDFSTNVKMKIKQNLERKENRNVLNFYVEFALVECELGNIDIAENILTNTLNETSITTQTKGDVYYSYVTMAEILLRQCRDNRALKVLTCLALDMPLYNIDDFEVTETKKIFAEKKLKQQCNDMICVERNIKTMDLEQYFLPDYFLCLLKATTYYQILLKCNSEAVAFLQSVLGNFSDNNPRFAYIRENVYELFLNTLRRKDYAHYKSIQLEYNVALNAIVDFPENVSILKICATLDRHPWYKLQKLFQRANTTVSVLFFICSARNHLLKLQTLDRYVDLSSFSSNTALIEATYHTRVVNILREATSNSSSLRKNSVVWRLYFRSLANTNKTSEFCKNVLFASLDECPWNKALYLDGSILVPEELSHIQDLIIEKQLRIYALPEELEILRIGFESEKESSSFVQ